MRNQQLKILFLLLFSLISYGQKNNVPKNLKEAVKILEKRAPKDLKEKIKITNNDSLIYLISPWGGKYSTISDWTTDSLPTPKIITYFNRKGIHIPKDQEKAILLAFKKKLVDGKFNEKDILLPIQNKERKRKSEELVKFTTDSINGIYIPKDLNDSFRELNNIWTDSTEVKIKKMEQGMHFGFGMWLRNNWGLWGGSRLSSYFNKLGINHPDDMSGIILESYQRYLSNAPIDLDSQISSSKNFWKKSEEARILAKKTEFEAYKLGDTVLFNYNNGFISTNQEEKYDQDACTATGIIIEKNVKDYFIKIKLIESCDTKGIISYDNINSLNYNEKTKIFEKPKKRIIRKMKRGEISWFYYSEWNFK